MSQTHDFFATTNDLPIIHDWLREAGGVPYDYSGFDDVPVDGREIVVHFPAIGPIEFWPDNIKINDFEENSLTACWKKAKCPCWPRKSPIAAGAKRDTRGLLVEFEHCKLQPPTIS